jgi:hypothetical protein
MMCVDEGTGFLVFISCIPEEPARVSMLFCERVIPLQRCLATDRNGNNESALLFFSGAYRGSNSGEMILAKGSSIVLSDFFFSHPHSDMLINDSPVREDSLFIRLP